MLVCVRVRLSEAYYEEKMSEQQSEIDRLLVERQKLQELQRQLSRVYSNMPSNTVRMRVCDLIQRRFTLLTTYTEFTTTPLQRPTPHYDRFFCPD